VSRTPPCESDAETLRFPPTSTPKPDQRAAADACRGESAGSRAAMASRSVPAAARLTSHGMRGVLGQRPVASVTDPWRSPVGRGKTASDLRKGSDDMYSLPRPLRSLAVDGRGSR